MALYLFYTMVQKKSKMTKNSDHEGPALKVHCHAIQWFFCAILLWGKIMAAVRFSMVAVLHTIRLCVDDRLNAGSSVRGGPMSVQLLRHARWHRSGFASCCWSKRVDLCIPFCLSLSISLAVDTGRSQFDDNTFRVLCRQALFCAPASRGLSCLWPLFGRPSGTGFDESRSAKSTLASTLGECTIGGVPPGKRQNEEEYAWYLGKTRWWEKHVQLLLS